MSKCPGCGTPIEWDPDGEWVQGEELCDCPGCGATLYRWGTAECCYRLTTYRTGSDEDETP
jgi:hypothetical protein